jgi:hypothetical protein
VQASEMLLCFFAAFAARPVLSSFSRGSMITSRNRNFLGDDMAAGVAAECVKCWNATDLRSDARKCHGAQGRMVRHASQRHCQIRAILDSSRVCNQDRAVNLRNRRRAVIGMANLT